ncbi:MAG: lipid-A-disaccharide synthase, partial [Acetobacteraceae bacterium]
VRHYPGLWDRLLCLLPFEPAFFARHGLPATFVGHPVLESGLADGEAERFRARYAIGADAPVLILMPGSRGLEIERLGGVFGAMLGRLQSAIPGLRPVVPAAADVRELVRRTAAQWPLSPILLEAACEKADAFAAASAALCKSGTSSLELALAGVPMAIAYRVNPLSAAIARRLIKVKYASLVNILAAREVVPELLQENCTPERLAATIGPLLGDPARAAPQRAEFAGVLRSLAPPEGTPSEAAARAVLELAC